MKRILVPIDFSEHSQNALEVATLLAKRFDARLILFHMIGISESVLSKSELEEQEEAKYYLQLAKKRFSSVLDNSGLAGIPVEIIIQNLKDFSEVDKVAKEKRVDLIIMGSHGTSGFSTFFVGSNTEKVIRTSLIPVMVIKTKHATFDIGTILFATDLKVESIPAYEKVAAFAEKLHAKLLVVYINTIGVTFQSNAQIQEKIKHFNDVVREKVTVEIYNDYTVEEGIFNHAKNIGVDIVSIPTHGRKGLAHFFLGSIGENLANTAKLPVLTVRI